MFFESRTNSGYIVAMKSNPGFFLEPASENSERVHWLGGKCNLQGAYSPNSGRPLTQLASLCLGGSGISWKSEGIKRLPLLYGWSCSISEGPFWYEPNYNKIIILKYVKGVASKDFPYENYPDSFPEIQVDAKKISSAQQEIISRINNSSGDERFDLILKSPNLGRPRHQVGGAPYFVGKLGGTPSCLRCNKSMSFFASIENGNYYSLEGFWGNNFAQLVFYNCTACNIICCINISD
jgi:hypothetical protein